MKIPDKDRPWFPIIPGPSNLKALYAIKALKAGEATPEQQALALEYIIEVIAWSERLSYFPDNPRDTDFAEGRRYVSEQLMKILKLTSKQLEAAKAR